MSSKTKSKLIGSLTDQKSAVDLRSGREDGDFAVIPFNRAELMGDEQRRVLDAICCGHISGDGRYTKLCHQILEESLGVHKSLLTTSCTHALEMAALLLNLGPGDEVIVPSFTFVSTVNAFVLRGARPIFADVRPDTLCMDESHVESLLTDRTKAIIPVHYAGVACKMDAIMAVARRNGVEVVEDNAHGIYGKYRGQYLGTFGGMATLSFHETKNFTCGEGGALLINDPTLVERAEIIREKGTNRSRFFRGQIDKYTWVDLGSSFLPSDMLAAFLSVQLESRDRIQDRRRQIWEIYHAALADWAQSSGVRQPIVPEDSDQAYHMYYLLLPSLDARSALIASLKSRGISAVFHYLPLHLSDMGRSFGGQSGDCPVTEDVSDRLVRLPFFVGLTQTQQQRIIDSILDFEVR